MANDIEGLTSSETASESCRAAALGTQSPTTDVEEIASKGDESKINMAYVKNDNLTCVGAVPNGCVHHHALDANTGNHASHGERFSPSLTDPGIFSGGSDCDSLSHDGSRLSEKNSDPADMDSQSSSTNAFTEEGHLRMTSGEVIVSDLPQFQDCEVSSDDKEDADTKTVTEMLTSAKISDDLPGVPLDTCGNEKSQAVINEPGGATASAGGECSNGIEYVMYESEKQMPEIMSLITKDLSEPYSIYTYRYFIHNWPNLCFLALHQGKCVGAIVCKLDTHKKIIKRGYIAMLAVAQEYRKQGIGSHLVIRAIKGMVADGCDEVVLETEITNKAALHLYENLGFVRDKRLFRYYLNGVDALRLKLWLK